MRVTLVRNLVGLTTRSSPGLVSFSAIPGSGVFANEILKGCNAFSSSSKPLNCQFPPNSSINPVMASNRNPRNLEKLRIGEKPAGWFLENEGKRFWNKVTLEISAKHITASVVHHLGLKPIKVSTKEWCLKKFLYNTNDASAAKLVGQVLAMRCLQAGITEVACFFTPDERRKEKINFFLSAIEDGGVALSEPSQVPLDFNIHHWELPETPWDVHEGVDDSYEIASKMPRITVRQSKYPKPKGTFGDSPLQNNHNAPRYLK